MAENSDGRDTSAGRPRSETDQVTNVKADHANVRAIFQQWDPTGLSAAKLLVQLGCDELGRHATLQKEELLSILSDIGITDRELPGKGQRPMHQCQMALAPWPSSGNMLEGGCEVEPEDWQSEGRWCGL
ncbi:unnamed protein product, partial [Cladocopium goreaui]